MRTAEEMIKEAIEEYNSKVNDMQKFMLNEAEISMFSYTLKAYTLQALQSVREVAVEYSKETTIENIDVLINELKAK